jgi:Fe-S cluster biosynthesis and repair protein YggX
MSDICNELHNMVNDMRRYTFPFDEKRLPKNGIYILFEKEELAHGGDRIVRVGTHQGDNRLISRLKEHFIIENKDRSIFRKNIGRAILNKRDKVFLEQWNWDLTSRVNREKYLPLLNIKKQKEVEREVTKYIQDNFSFAIIEEKSKDKRVELESKIISTVSHCIECKSSNLWLGNSSPVDKIKKSGLWLVQGLYRTPLNKEELNWLK